MHSCSVPGRVFPALRRREFGEASLLKAWAELLETLVVFVNPPPLLAGITGSRRRPKKNQMCFWQE